MSEHLGKTAKLIRLLEQAGVTESDLQRLIDDRWLRAAFVNLLRQPRPDAGYILPDQADLDAVRTLVDSVWPWSDWVSEQRDRVLSWDEQRAALCSDWPGLRMIMEECLDRRQQEIVYKVHGLSGCLVTLKSIGEPHLISGARVHDIDKRALQKLREGVRCIASKKYFTGGDAPIEALESELPTAVFRKLLREFRNAHIDDLAEDRIGANLTSFYRFTPEEVDTIQAALEARGLRLPEQRTF